MVLRYWRISLVAAIALAPLHAAFADEWWMSQTNEAGERFCGPPLEAEGVVLTPDEMLNRFEECKLMDETPSLDLKNVMVACEGDLNQVFLFSRSKEGCEELAKSMSQ